MNIHQTAVVEPCYNLMQSRCGMVQLRLSHAYCITLLYGNKPEQPFCKPDHLSNTADDKVGLRTFCANFSSAILCFASLFCSST